jgi:hypothetical protein
MIRYIFIILICYGIYSVYIKPKLTAATKVVNDEKLKVYLNNIFLAEDYDKRSVEKVKHFIRLFFLQYSKTFDTPSYRTNKRLVFYKDKVQNYSRRIIFRLPNDIQLEQIIKTSVENIDRCLEAYVVEASNRNHIRYFPQHT